MGDQNNNKALLILNLVSLSLIIILAGLGLLSYIFS